MALKMTDAQTLYLLVACHSIDFPTSISIDFANGFHLEILFNATISLLNLNFVDSHHIDLLHGI